MIDRNLFTSARSTLDKATDALFAIVLALLLTVGALAYFDILVK